MITQAKDEAVFIERRGQRAAVVISPEQYERMLEALEDAEDAEAFDEAMAEEGPNIPWAQVKALKRIDHQDRDRIALLGENPRPTVAKALRGRPGFRVRVGDYRIIYTIVDDLLIVVVVTLGHRRDVYERQHANRAAIR